MKHGKKILTLTSFLLGSTLLASCSGTVNVVTFNEYWKTNADANLTTFSENLRYAVSYEETSGLTDAYSVSYSDGSYTTKLTLENNRYCYETELQINVTFSVGDKTQTHTDSVRSKIILEKAANNLRPIESFKEIVNHTPLNASEANEPSDCYATVDYTVSVQYEDDLSEGTATVTNRGNAEATPQENTFEIDDKKARYLDNEQLYLAMRGVNPSSFSAPKLLAYAPFTSAVQNINASFSSSTEGGEFEFTRNGAAFKNNINYRTVTLTIDSKNSGASQTLWIAETQASSLNKNRNLILRIETPLSYNMGKLVYRLTEETYTEA